MATKRLQYRKQIAKPQEFEYRYKDEEDRTVVVNVSKLETKVLALEIEKQKAKASKWFKRYKFCQELSEVLQQEMEHRLEQSANIITVSQ